MGCELLGTFLLCLLPPLIIDNQTLANNDSSQVSYCECCFVCCCSYHQQPDFGEQRQFPGKSIFFVLFWKKCIFFVNFKMDHMFKLSPCLQCFLLLFSLFLQTTFQSMFEGLARRYGGCDGPDCGHQWDGDIRGHVSFLSHQGLCRFSFDFLRRQGAM